mmetsp:Transcript_87971/g.272452  ORF Transcript_87971/g.272452 Transcript_87971/m.272452 type:complete len:226 (+) Transcript_87971:370-1047(+)
MRRRLFSASTNSGDVGTNTWTVARDPPAAEAGADVLQGGDGLVPCMRAGNDRRGVLRRPGAHRRSWVSASQHDEPRAVRAGQQPCAGWLRIQDGTRHALLLGRDLWPARAGLPRGRRPRTVPLLREGGLRERALPLLLLPRRAARPALLGQRLQGRPRPARLLGRWRASGVPPLRGRRIRGRSVPIRGGPPCGLVYVQGQTRDAALLGLHVHAGHSRLLGGWPSC